MHETSSTTFYFAMVAGETVIDMIFDYQVYSVVKACCNYSENLTLTFLSPAIAVVRSTVHGYLAAADRGFTTRRQRGVAATQPIGGRLLRKSSTSLG